MFGNTPLNFVTQVKWPFNPYMQRTAPLKIDVPNGVPSSALKLPNFVDVPGMSAALRSGSTVAQGSGGHLGTVNGLVTSKLSLRFEDAHKQWKSRPLGGQSQGPVEFTFQGGKVFIDLSMGIYVLNTNRPAPGDAVSDKIFAIVYSHELLHVLDNVEMLNNWFLPKLKVIPLIDNYLVKQKPYVYGRVSDAPRLLCSEFPKFITEKLETEAHNLWAVEANRRQALRDAPAEYKKVQEKVNDLGSSRVMPRR